MWDEITYPCPNFNGCTVEVWEWISHFIPQFIIINKFNKAWRENLKFPAKVREKSQNFFFSTSCEVKVYQKSDNKMPCKGIQFLKLSWCKILWDFNVWTLYAWYSVELIKTWWCICIIEQCNHWFNSKMACCLFIAKPLCVLVLPY